jgi:hypothetical protein
MAHKRCLKTTIVSNSYIKIISLSHPLAQKIAIMSMFLLEFTQIKGKTYEIYTSWRCKTSQCKMQALMKLIGVEKH